MNVYLESFLILIGITLLGGSISITLKFILKKKAKFNTSFFKIISNSIVIFSFLVGLKYSLLKVLDKISLEYIKNETLMEIINVSINVLFILIGSFIIANLFTFIFNNYVQKMVIKSKTDIDDKIFEVLNRYIYVLFFLLGLKILLKTNRLTILSKVIVIQKSLLHGINILLIIIVAMVSIKTIIILLDGFAESRAKKSNKNGNLVGIVPLFKNISRILIWTIAGSIIIKEFGYSPVSLIAGMGIIGMAVSFAAQDSLSNFISGIFILFDGPFMLKDRIKVGDLVGEVVEIGIRTTRIKTLDDLVITIPNSTITNTEIINYNRPRGNIKVYHPMGVAYGSDVENVKKVLKECMSKTTGIIKGTEGVYFLEFADSSLNFKMTFSIEHYSKKWGVLDKLNTLINRRFEEENIDIPYPIMTVKMDKE